MAENEKILFTPGPLTTSPSVKAVMQRDLGSRDAEFISLVSDIRLRLLKLGKADPAEYTAILMQGSGTFAIESVIGSVIPPHGRLLVLVNGAYGRRMAQIARLLHISVQTLDTSEAEIHDLQRVEELLLYDTAITHVAVVHCETTTGILNPAAEVCAIARRCQRASIVDAMSSFGAYPVDLPGWGADFVISSANKCIEGVPGFGFILARLAALHSGREWARSLSLNLWEQWQGLESNGQFRFTPPTHALMAFHQALVELELEGGPQARLVRYCQNHRFTVGGMQTLGFQTYLKPELQSCIITSFDYPLHPNFDFEVFYETLSHKGFVIYPGKLSQARCFRIGHIGQIDSQQVQGLLAAIAETLGEMGVELVSGSQA